MAQLDLEQIAKDLVDKATAAGASSADVVALEGEEFSTALRLGKIEKLKEASSKGLGLRVFIGTQSASAYSSDFSPASLKTLVERTLEMARETSEDPASSLPDPALLGRYDGDLELYCPDVAALSHRRTHCLGAPGGSGGDGHRSPHPQLRGRVVRIKRGHQGLRQLGGICGQLPRLLRLGGGFAHRPG